MWVRIARYYPIVYIPQALARYRMQEASNTGRNVRSARDVLFNGIAIDLIESYLPPGIARGIAAKARRTYARSALASAHELARKGDVPAALAQFRAALGLSKAPGTLLTAARALLAIARASLRRNSMA